jgi:hypothetical protein
MVSLLPECGGLDGSAIDCSAVGFCSDDSRPKLKIDSFWMAGLLFGHVQLRNEKGGDPMSSGMSSAQVDFGVIDDVGTCAL